MRKIENKISFEDSENLGPENLGCRTKSVKVSALWAG